MFQGWRRKASYWFICSFSLWFILVSAILTFYLTAQRDSKAKFCHSVKSATCAGCSLILYVNWLMYCYQRKKKTNKKKQQQQQQKKQQSQLCSLVLPCKKEFRSNSPGQQGLEMLETIHSAPRREGTSGRFWTTPLWLMPEVVLIWLE